MLSQHDNFFAMLTPRESVELAAYLEFLKQKKNDATIKDNHKEVAKRKLSLLGLSSVADRRIGDRTKIGANTGGGGWIPKANKMISKVRRNGGLSGGERRRLSVALELITEPKIFLADEPTTGLDSAQAEKVVKLIAVLAKERSVPSICTLHQPKSTIWQTLVSCWFIFNCKISIIHSTASINPCK
jgi:ABC-type multidrug transport system ATPase subunit